MSDLQILTRAIDTIVAARPDLARWMTVGTHRADSSWPLRDGAPVALCLNPLQNGSVLIRHAEQIDGPALLLSGLFRLAADAGHRPVLIDRGDEGWAVAIWTWSTFDGEELRALPGDSRSDEGWHWHAQPHIALALALAAEWPEHAPEVDRADV